jgi:hypothetical protein
MRRKQVLREMMLDGVISIVEKLNPRIFEAKFANYRDSTAAAQRVARLVVK